MRRLRIEQFLRNDFLMISRLPSYGIHFFLLYPMEQLFTVFIDQFFKSLHYFIGPLLVIVCLFWLLKYRGIGTCQSLPSLSFLIAFGYSEFSEWSVILETSWNKTDKIYNLFKWNNHISHKEYIMVESLLHLGQYPNGNAPLPQPHTLTLLNQLCIFCLLHKKRKLYLIIITP